MTEKQQKIIYKDFEPIDLNNYAEMWNISEFCYPGGNTGGGGMSSSDVLDDLERYTLIKRTVAVCNNEIIGSSDVVDLGDSETLFFHRLNVVPMFQKKMVGYNLIKHGLNTIFEIMLKENKKYKKIVTETWPSNDRLRLIVLRKLGAVELKAGEFVSFVPLLFHSKKFRQFIRKQNIINMEQLLKNLTIKPFNLAINNENQIAYAHEISKENKNFIAIIDPARSEIIASGINESTDSLIKNIKHVDNCCGANKKHISKKAVLINHRKSLEVSCVARDAEKIVIENDFFRMIFLFNKGMLLIYDYRRNKHLCCKNFEILGPPFSGIKAFSFNEFSGKIKRKSKKSIELIIKAKNSKKRSLQIKKIINIDASPLIIIETQLINKSDNLISVKCQRPGLCLQDGSNIVVPHKHGIVKNMIILGDFPDDRYRDLSVNPSDYMKNWCAFEKEGFVLGYLWEDADKAEYGFMKLPYTYVSVSALKGGNKHVLPKEYLLYQKGDWQNVNEYDNILLQNINGKYSYPSEDKIYDHYIFIEELDELNVCNSKNNFLNVKINSARRKPESIKINLQMPDSWTFKIDKNSNKVSSENPILANIQFSFPPETKSGIYSGKIHVYSKRNALVKDFYFMVVNKHQNSIKIEAKEKGGKNIIINNGILSMDVSSNIGGSISNLVLNRYDHSPFSENACPEVENFFTFSSRKKDITFSLKNTTASDFLCQNLPSEINGFPFDMEASVYKKTSKSGLNFFGVKLESYKTNKDFPGIKVDFFVLTMPMSPLILFAIKLLNNGLKPVDLQLLFTIFNTITRNPRLIYYKNNSEFQFVKQNRYSSYLTIPRAAIVSDKKNDNFQGIYTSSPLDNVLVGDLGKDGFHFFLGDYIKLNPKGIFKSCFLYSVDSLIKSKSKFLFKENFNFANKLLEKIKGDFNYE